MMKHSQNLASKQAMGAPVAIKLPFLPVIISQFSRGYINRIDPRHANNFSNSLFDSIHDYSKKMFAYTMYYSQRYGLLTEQFIRAESGRRRVVFAAYGTFSSHFFIKGANAKQHSSRTSTKPF